MCLGLELHSNFSTSMDYETSFQKNGVFVCVCVCVMQIRILYEFLKKNRKHLNERSMNT